MRLGITPEAIRKAAYRKKKKGVVDEPIRDLGMNLEPDWKAKVCEAQRLMKEDYAALRKQTTLLTNLLASDDAVVQRPRVMRLLELVDEAATLAKELIPSSLCPGCKGLDGVQEQCQFCCGAGHVTQGQEAGIPREIWDNTVVQVNGEIVPIKSLPGVYQEVGEERDPDIDAGPSDPQAEGWGF